MPNWRDEYVASIKEADEADPVNTALILACSTLQDQVAALQAENALLRSTTAKVPETDRLDLSNVPDAETPRAQLRVDLTEALRSQGKLQLRLKTAEEELESLRLSNRTDSRTIRTLTNERNALLIKVRDRDEELRGKSKLVEDVQDELIALNLQLNIAEQQRDKIREENKQLVDRWMQRMGQEAEAMNIANEPYFARSS
ncbi:autophagy protein [Grosmannia clavigera kw1407]|uniref:Autophagy protein n=1 Tax=Grosmannia clavigera (strain kw1407 / UAMH 11150) TaxID=655863 RepID=F0XIY0_GROCL|nr:autophagy protein [Grosmannia clavigera kw1407]EFX02265.1 autophagy protein [Grosmannia clavigera kw1407]